MAKQADLNIEIKVNGEAPEVRALKVGANPQPPNNITFSVNNRGDSIRWTPQNPLRLTISLGEKKEGLFFNDSDARACVRSVPSDWKADWKFPNDGIGLLTIYSFRKSLEKSETLEIGFSGVVSKTDPEGAAKITLESADPDFHREFSIPKTSDRPDIIYFISEPEEGVQNLPGDRVMLKWRTNKLTNRVLNQVGISNPLTADFGTDEGAREISVSAADMTFRLTGYPEGGFQPVQQELTVKVLRQGWHGIRNTIFEGDPGYPSPANDDEARALDTRKPIDLEPTLLLNANDQCLYGIFRYVFQGKERALLFQSTNPFGPWKFVESSVRDQPGDSRIPEGFSTSPGVYFDDKLWLIGGSQIDPEIVSKNVWCLDPKDGVWKNWGAVDWPPRMGHAVLKFQGKIWVMGGRDEAGNALNDVWSLDVTTKKWTSLGEAPWERRCLFNPAVFQNQIWLYGGAQEPFAAKLYDDVHIYKSGSWTKLDMTGIITGTLSRKPIASCLQEFKGRLYLFGKFRTIDDKDKSETVEPLAFSLSTPSTKTWETFPNDGLKNWGGDTTFNYQLINFNNRMLIAKALSYEAPNPEMKVYVP